MAYLAVNKNGSEIIVSDKPIRWPQIEKLDRRKKHQVLSIDDQTNWAYPYYSDEPMEINLPKGTIEKIIGRKLTWLDEPVEI